MEPCHRVGAIYSQIEPTSPSMRPLDLRTPRTIYRWLGFTQALGARPPDTMNDIKPGKAEGCHGESLGRSRYGIQPDYLSSMEACDIRPRMPLPLHSSAVASQSCGYQLIPSFKSLLQRHFTPKALYSLDLERKKSYYG